MESHQERKYNKSLKDKHKGREFVGVSSLFKRAREEERRLHRDWGAKSDFFNWTKKGRKFPSFITWRRREERLKRRKERRANKRLREKREEGALEGVEHVFKVGTYVRKRRTAFREKLGH